MTDIERMTERGNKIAQALNLRKTKQDDGTPFDPPRFQLGKEHGTKTAVGVYLTIERLWEENRMDTNL